MKLQLSMQECGDQPEPSLPSAEELRERVALGELGQAGVAAAPAGSLDHLMLVSAQCHSLLCTWHTELQCLEPGRAGSPDGGTLC